MAQKFKTTRQVQSQSYRNAWKNGAQLKLQEWCPVEDRQKKKKKNCLGEWCTSTAKKMLDRMVHSQNYKSGGQ